MLLYFVDQMIDRYVKIEDETDQRYAMGMDIFFINVQITLYKIKIPNPFSLVLISIKLEISNFIIDKTYCSYYRCSIQDRD